MSHEKPLAEDTPHIVRRLGHPPSHRGCGCPESYRQVLFLTPGGDFAVVLGDIVPDEERDAVNTQIRELDPDAGGGIAPYETFGTAARRDFMRSEEELFRAMGFVAVPGGEQDPLFLMAHPEFVVGARRE